MFQKQKIEISKSPQFCLERLHILSGLYKQEHVMGSDFLKFQAKYGVTPDYSLPRIFLGYK